MSTTDSAYTFADREYVVGFGERGYGDGYYGGGRITNNLTDAVANWPIPAIDMGRGTEQRKLLRALVNQLYRIDIDLDELYESRFIEMASGRELELHGEAVGIEREAGEEDNRLRRRIKVRYAQRSSRGTYDDIAKVTKIILDSENFEILPAEAVGGGHIEVRIRTSALDDTPFDIEEIQSMIAEAVIATDVVNVTTENSFVFSSDGSAYGAGWGQGTWTSPE